MVGTARNSPPKRGTVCSRFLLLTRKASLMVPVHACSTMSSIFLRLMVTRRIHEAFLSRTITARMKWGNLRYPMKMSLMWMPLARTSLNQGSFL